MILIRLARIAARTGLSLMAVSIKLARAEDKNNRLFV
jgi:hypothetical protein